MAKQPSGGAAIGEQELVRRKDFLEFRDDDLANLTTINDVARRYADSVIDDFFTNICCRSRRPACFFAILKSLSASRERNSNISCA